MKLNYKRTILVGLAFFAISIFWQLYEFYIPLILKNQFNIGDTWAGFIMSIDNILALFMLPLFGVLSDRTHTRMGRRMPFILFGTIASVILMLLIPFSVHTRQIVLFMVVLGALLIAMATYRSPAVALMPDVTVKPLRSIGNGVINLMGAVGGALFLLLNNFIAVDTQSADPNYWPVFLVTAAIMVAGTAILLLTVNEKKLVKQMREDSAKMGIDPEEAGETEIPVKETKEKLAPEYRKSMGLILASIALWFMGYNAITTAFSKYAVHQLGMDEGRASLILMVAMVAAIASFLPSGYIAVKIGRKKTILFGVVLLAAVFGSAALYTAYSPLMFVSFGLAGVAWAAINVNSLPMVLEMSKGATVGKFTGYYYAFSMSAQIVTPILSGALLEYVGYHTLLPYGAFFVALAFFTMLFVKHGDSKPMPPKGKMEALGEID
jgi:maltose/moltooligosaccharide transporter